MMYLIFNNKGELKEKNINELIVQGSNNVNKIGVAIEDVNPLSYTVVGVCKLPNGEVITTTPSDTVEEIIDGVNGVVFSLNKAITSLSGLLRINIQAISLTTDKTITSYTVYLLVNEGVDPGEIVMMTNDQYTTLVNMIEKDVKLDETILALQANSMPPYTDFELGQMLYFHKLTTPTERKLYTATSTGWEVVFDFDDYYNKENIDLKINILNGRIDAEKLILNNKIDQNYNTLDNKIDSEVGALEDAINTKSTVSGTFYGNNWKTITIDGITKNTGGGTIYEAGYGINIGGDDTISINTEVVATQNDLQNVREVAEGKCKTFVLSYATTGLNREAPATVYYKADGTPFTSWEEIDEYIGDNACGNPLFNSQGNTISILNKYLLTYNWTIIVPSKNHLKNGDIILVIETDVPDRWVGIPTDYLHKLETSKIDLDSYYTKSQTNGFIGDVYSNQATYSIGKYVIYNNALYRCITAINSPEDFDSSKWVQCKLADVMVDLDSAQTITGTKTFAAETFTDKLTPRGSGKNIGGSANRYNAVFANYLNAGIAVEAPRINRAGSSYGINIPDTSSYTANKDMVLSDSDQIFNVINASTMFSSGTTLTDSSYAIITNGRPTKINGTISNKTDLFFVNAIDLNTSFYTGICYCEGGTYGQVYQWSISKSTKQLNIATTSANILFNGGYIEIKSSKLNDLQELNSKQFPAYPTTNSTPQVLSIAKNGGALSFKDTLTSGSVTTSNGYFSIPTPQDARSVSISLETQTPQGMDQGTQVLTIGEIVLDDIRDQLYITGPDLSNNRFFVVLDERGLLQNAIYYGNSTTICTETVIVRYVFHY